VINTCCFNRMCFSHAILIALIEKYELFTCLKDTCHFYMWVVQNFCPIYTLFNENQKIKRKREKNLNTKGRRATIL